jgi:hypothetical protein
MVAFATIADLELLTGRVIPVEQVPQVEALLDAASSYLRGVIGQEVFPTTTSTYVAYPNGGREDLPQWPVVAVVSVQRDEVDVTYTYRPGFILVDCDDPVDVTFTWGYATAPAELNRMTCVLVGQTLTTLELGLGLSVGGLSSVSIDDFKAAFADGGSGTGMTLSPHAEASVKRQFGQGGVQSIETGW